MGKKYGDTWTSSGGYTVNFHSYYYGGDNDLFILRNKDGTRFWENAVSHWVDIKPELYPAKQTLERLFAWELLEGHIDKFTLPDGSVIPFKRDGDTWTAPPAKTFICGEGSGGQVISTVDPRTTSKDHR